MNLLKKYVLEKIDYNNYCLIIGLIVCLLTYNVYIISYWWNMEQQLFLIQENQIIIIII